MKRVKPDSDENPYDKYDPAKPVQIKLELPQEDELPWSDELIP